MGTNCSFASSVVFWWEAFSCFSFVCEVCWKGLFMYNVYHVVCDTVGTERGDYLYSTVRYRTCIVTRFFLFEQGSKDKGKKVIVLKRLIDDWFDDSLFVIKREKTMYSIYKQAVLMVLVVWTRSVWSVRRKSVATYREVYCNIARVENKFGA